MTATAEKTVDLVVAPGLVTGQGTTTIADVVVQKIAGLATREVPGVHALGGGAARALGALRDRIPGASASAGQGVAVEVGEKQAAVDLEIVVEYGVPIADLSRQVRRSVIGAIERMTGLEVVEVNISVGDVHIPSADEEPTTSDRVR
ncbi:Asp23/Gls24 family envelope stress response protein [Amycolatopsis sp. NPDC004368]